MNMSLETKNFDNLDFSLQIEIIKKAPYFDKADLILRSENPKDLLQSLSNEEFYLVYSSSSNDLKAEIVEQGKALQLVFVSDFEVWKKDEIDSPKFFSWLDILNQGNADTYLLWVLEADFELIVAGLIDSVEVIKTEHLELIDDYIGDKPFVTLDNLYYFNIECDFYDSVRSLIDILYERKKPQYVYLMEALIAASKAEIEEAAYQLKIERGALNGFPEKDEAMIIYNEISDLSLQDERDERLDLTDNYILSYETFFPVLQSKESLFIDDIISLLTEKNININELNAEFISVANKIIVCDELDFKNPNVLYEALSRSRKIASIALEELSNLSLNKAVDLLNRHYVETLFRYGMMVLKKIKSLALNIIDEMAFKEINNFLHFTGDYIGIRFRGTLNFCPVKPRRDSEFEILEFDDFKTFSEVKESLNEFLEIKQLLLFFKKCFGKDWEKIVVNAEKNIKKFINVNTLLGTLIVNYSLNNDMSFEPLSINDLEIFIKEGFEIFEGKKIIKRITREKILNEILDNSNNRKITENIFDAVENELKFLNVNLGIEGKYIENILVK